MNGEDQNDWLPVKTTKLEWALIVALIVGVILYFGGFA